MTPAARPGPRFPSRLPLAAALVLLTLAVHAPSIGFEFVDYDDNDYVYANPQVRGGLDRDSIAWAFRTTHAANWHPLTWLSLMADATLSGPGPRGFHRTNVALHVANVLLWWLALAALTGSNAKSAVVAAVFAVHPLNVQAVAWISERKELLATLFGTASLLGYAAHARRRSPLFYAASLAAYAGSLLSKPMWVTLPGLLLLLDFWPLRRRLSLRSLAEKLPYLALAAGASIAALMSQTGGGTVAEIPAGTRLAHAVVSYAIYLRRAFWPSGLACFYPYPATAPGALTLGGALLLLAAATAVAIRLARSRPYLAVGWGWFAGTLVPVLGLVQIGAQRTADRYVYLPLVGLVLALVWLAASVPLAPRRRRPLLGGATLLVVAALALGARQAAAPWRDSSALWQRALAVTRDNYLAHNHLGTLAGMRGDYGGSIRHLERAVALRPGYASAHANLAKALALAGRPRAAEEHFRRALTLDPGMHTAHVNWALALAAEGRLAEAVSHLQAAAELAPQDARIRDLLAEARRRLGQPSR